MSSTPPREVRDRLRKEVAKLRALANKEYQRPAGVRRQHVIDGLNVAMHILDKMAREMAAEAQAQELIDLVEDSEDPGA